MICAGYKAAHLAGRDAFERAQRLAHADHVLQGLWKVCQVGHTGLHDVHASCTSRHMSRGASHCTEWDLCASVDALQCSQAGWMGA